MTERRRGYRWSKLFICLLALAFVSANVVSVTFAVESDQQQTTVDNPKPLFKQARKLDRKSRLDEAEAVYRRILEIDPHFSDARLALAYLLAKRHSVREA